MPSFFRSFIFPSSLLSLYLLRFLRLSVPAPSRRPTPGGRLGVGVGLEKEKEEGGYIGYRIMRSLKWMDE